MNQRDTIRELTAKLSRCEGQALPAGGPGARRPGGKNTMGDVSRGTSDTLAQLGHTLQTLKQRLENLEVCTTGDDVSLLCPLSRVRRVRGGPVLCPAAVQPRQQHGADQEPEGPAPEPDRRHGEAGPGPGQHPGGAQERVPQRQRSAQPRGEHPHVPAPPHHRPGERCASARLTHASRTEPRLALRNLGTVAPVRVREAQW